MMDSFVTPLLLFFTGLFAGGVDSIAGGGGLITLPVLSRILEPGPHAIGTNKIVGTAGACIAFFVYWRRQRLSINRGLIFVTAVGLGSVLGSLVSPLLPRVYFKYLLFLACPLVLWSVFNKDQWSKVDGPQDSGAGMTLAGVGMAVGFYDGFFGPGGGTFMLIGLLWIARLPLLESLLLSKLANTLSAGFSLISYGFQGFVHPQEGAVMAGGMIIGGFLGATLATKKAEKIVRPVLVLVVLILLFSQF